MIIMVRVYCRSTFIIPYMMKKPVEVNESYKKVVHLNNFYNVYITRISHLILLLLIYIINGIREEIE